MTKTIATLFLSNFGSILYKWWLDSFYVDGTVTSNVEISREIPLLSRRNETTLEIYLQCNWKNIYLFKNVDT